MFFGCFLVILLIFSLAGLTVLVNPSLQFGIWFLLLEDEEHSKSMLEEIFFGLLFYWARVWGLTLEISLPAFVVSLNFSKSPSIALM